MADIPPPPPGTPPSGPPQYTPPPYQPPASPSYSDIPPTAQAPQGYIPPGYVPPAGYPVQPAGINMASQFTGIAMWSIILGVASIGLPLVTGLVSSGGTYYFIILPIFGLIRGFQAITRGQMIGGVVGIVLNILGGFMSLIASGLLFH